MPKGEELFELKKRRSAFCGPWNYQDMLSHLREKYWELSRKRSIEAGLRSPENRAFSAHLKREVEQVPTLAAEIKSEQIEPYLESAVHWLLLAQQATNDAGVSLGYFPVGPHKGWMPSYPETTGYIITSLLKYATRYGEHSTARAAIQMADWEIDVQMESGAVQGGPVSSREKQTPAAFNTGMVADGWMSAYEFTGDQKYLDAALRASRFLADDLDYSGFFQTNGDFVSAGEVKTYTCLCAWAMYRAALAGGDTYIKESSIRSIEAALSQRNELGWFKNNCLTHSSKPLTHTIGYALQGIFEVGVLAGREDFVDAARYSLTGALAFTHDNGYLAGRLDDNWKPRAEYVCLTGSVQLAILCFRFAEELGEHQFLSQGHSLTNFVKATQLLRSSNECMVGAIAGSFPMMGEYMQGGYPNWATKYYVDALMLQQDLLKI